MNRKQEEMFGKGETPTLQWPTLIAEISNAHNGDEARAHRLIDAAIDAMLDAHEATATVVKFQAYTPHDLVVLRGDGPAPDPWGSDGWTMLDLYEKAQTPLEWFPRLIEHCRDLHQPWAASVFGVEGLAAMRLLGCRIYKLASLDHRARWLLERVRATGARFVIRSVPLKRRPAKLLPNEYVLYCPPGYPQVEVDFTRMRRGKFDGLSYRGTSPIPPALAFHLGARIVEAHIHLEAEPSELEANISLTERDFARLAQFVNDMLPSAELATNDDTTD
jgi:sialic acid synthase SpsE